MSSFEDALKAEIAGLERDLASDPRYVKLREAKRLLALYVGGDERPASTERQAPASSTRPFASGTSAKIVDVVRGFIANRSDPTPTREIMEELSKRGIEVRGSAPQNTVSSLLSKSSDFKSHGRSGWTLCSVAGSYDTEKADDAAPGQVTSSALFEVGPHQPDEHDAQGREAGPGGGT